MVLCVGRRGRSVKFVFFLLMTLPSLLLLHYKIYLKSSESKATPHDCHDFQGSAFTNPIVIVSFVSFFFKKAS